MLLNDKAILNPNFMFNYKIVILPFALKNV